LRRQSPVEAALAAVKLQAGLARAHDPDWYVLADGLLGLRSTEEAFATRFRENYRECAAGPDEEGSGPGVRCAVSLLAQWGVVLVEFEGSPAPGDPEFPARILSLRHQPIPAERPGWWLADPDHPVGEVAFARDRVLMAAVGPWRAFAASLAVSRCLAAQPGILFFHGAATRINGRGVLLLGVSGSGKTSVSLELASRGHGFFGDDIVGVRTASREIVPLRRSAHVRQGPSGPAVRAALSRSGPSGEGTRIRADVGTLFPAAAVGPATMDYVVCLRRFADRTRLEPFHPRAEDVRWLTPHASTLASGPLGRQAMRVVSLFAASPCFFLDAASPESAADSLERLTE
jgi:hypothetical protein